MAGRQAGVNKSKDLADTLRELIESRRWPPGHLVPSQSQLRDEHGVSVETVRGAIERLTQEGLVSKRQGSQPRVADREPAYRLVIEPPSSQAGRVAEPPVTFRGSPHRAEVREWQQHTVDMHWWSAELLGFEPGTTMIERAMRLTIGGTPVLSSTSYLPADLPDVAGRSENWRKTDVGRLALAGHELSYERMEVRSRMPAPGEAEALRVDRGVPLFVLSRRVGVTMPECAARAGIIVLAPADRVCLDTA